MDRKKSLIAMLALVVFLGSILFVVSNMSGKKQPISTEKKPVVEKKVPNKTSGQAPQGVPTKPETLESQGEKKEGIVTDIGTIESMIEKILTVKRPDGSIVVNVDSSMTVTINSSSGESSVGKLTDLETGDLVKVTYDKITKNVAGISVMKLQLPEGAEKM